MNENLIKNFFKDGISIMSYRIWLGNISRKIHWGLIILFCINLFKSIVSTDKYKILIINIRDPLLAISYK